MRNVKKTLLVTSALTAVVCGCFALVACKDGGETTAFDAPQNVAVDTTTSRLSWDTVDGAAQYTVKINSDETTVVSFAWLDLTTVTAKLTEGDNTLSVKANATDAHSESAYSAEVTYTYAPAPTLQEFAAPKNVRVSGDKLTWDGVTGASSYTVKINDDETLNNVTATELDLTTVTAKLRSGANTLSVKTNANGDIKASGYSTAATYDYAPPLEVEIADYTALVGAIDAESTNAATFKAALDAAANKYNGLSSAAKADAAVIAAKAEFDTAKGVYDGAKALYDEFKSAYDEAIAEMTKAESLTALTTKVDAATEKYTALGALAKSMVSAAEKTAYDELAATPAQWEINIAAALVSLDYQFDFDGEEVDLATDDYAACEADIAGASAVLTAYDGYADYIKAALGTETKTELESAVATRKGYVDTAVAALIAEVEAALEATTPSEANYAALEAMKDKLDGITLGAYGAAKYAEDYKSYAASKTELSGAMNTMLNTAVGEPAVSANTSVNGDSRKLFIAVSFKNFRGDVIAVDDAMPQVTVDFEKTEATSGSNVTVSQQLTKNADDDNYVAIIYMYGVGGLSSASYKIGDGSAIDIDVTPTLTNNPYFTNDGAPFKNAFNDEIIIISQNGFTDAANYPTGHIYLEMYEEGSIEKDTEDFIMFIGQPIAERIDVTNWTATKEQKIDEFNRYLALNYGDYFIGHKRSVHFVIYGEATVGGNTTPSRTAVGLGTVSNAREFNLTEDDKYYHFTANIMESGIDDSGVLSMFTPGRIGELATEINNKIEDVTLTTGDGGNIDTYVRVKVETLCDDEVIFTTYAPLTFRGYTLAQLASDCSEIYYVQQGNSDARSYENISVRVSFAWTDDATEEMKNTFSGGATMTVALKEGQTTLTLDKTPYTVPSTVMRLSGGGNAYEFFRDEKNAAGNTVAGYVIGSGNVKYAKLDFYRTNDAEHTVKFTAYIHNVDGNTKLSMDETYDSENPSLGMDIITNAWTGTDTFTAWFTNTAHVKVDGFALRWDDGWSVSARYVRTDDSEYLFDGAPNVLEISEAVAATAIPTAAQIGFDGVGNVTFVRASGAFKNGEVFTTGAASEVEIHFYQGDTETTDYMLSLRYDIETGECKLYDGETAVSNALNGGVGDLWCDGTTLDNAVRAYLTAKEVANANSFHYSDGWKFYSVIIAREGNVIWTGAKGEASATVSYTPAA